MSILDRWFSDVWNPTELELKKWMEDPEAFEVEQDWDLSVGSYLNLHALARVASGDGPQREYIVHCLYIATADAFQAIEVDPIGVPTIEDAVKLVPDNANADVLEWRRKAQKLIEEPTTFQSNEWFSGLYGDT